MKNTILVSAILFGISLLSGNAVLATSEDPFSSSDLIGNEKYANFDNVEKKGTCIYPVFTTVECVEDVTKKWCDKKVNSEWSEGEFCP